jgi:multidrug transporter EmrE-like cation transporter
MFFMLVYYGIFVIVSRTRIHFKELFKNPWMWIISILFVVADRFLFIANSYTDARVTVMTLLKQSCCIVTILGGKFIFKEKNTLQRFVCASIIIAGIVISVI